MLTICGMYPQYQEKIYQEIHSELGTDPENVTPESVQKLQYLDMCLKEILRLFPIAPFIMRKTTEDVQIGKRIFIFIWNSIYSIMNHNFLKYFQ